MGMQLLRKLDNPEYKYTLAFIGYGDEAENTVIELTYNWDQSEYDLGDGYGHIAIEVEDIYQTCEQISAAGATISRAPGPVKGGSVEIAFVKDPDGYAIELIQKQDKIGF